MMIISIQIDMVNTSRICGMFNEPLNNGHRKF